MRVAQLWRYPVKSMQGVRLPAVHLRDGDVYSVEEVRAWLPEAGWRFVEHRPLAGPQSVIVAEAE